MRISALVAGVLIAAFALFLVLVGAVFCAGTLHVSRRLSPTPGNAEVIQLTARDNAKLTAWRFQADRPNGRCVMVLHGIGDSRAGSAGFAPMFLAEGYTVLIPDSRAHGASGGSFITYGLLEKYDVLAWAAQMRTAGCGRIYALGESLGAAILIQAAALEPAFNAIVAEGAYADLRGAAEYRTRRMLPLPAVVSETAAFLIVNSGLLYARFIHGLDFRDASPINAIQHVTTPILFIHGLEDFRTPSHNSEILARANARNRLWLVPNAVHTGAAAAQPNEFRRRVLAWFAEH